MNTASKNTLREITKSKSRFLSILLICAIGVGFFSGVRATGGDMIKSADVYFDEHNMFDLRVLSTFGLTDTDLEVIKEIDGVDGAYASKYTDLAMYVNDVELLTRVYSKTPDEINTIEIYEGRAPEADDEAIINYYSFNYGVEVGGTVTLADITNADEFPLKYKEYKIVGKYHTPLFVSTTGRGSTNIGDGALDALMIVPEEHFVQEPYTEIYIKSEKLQNAVSYSDEYNKLREEISERLEKLGEDRSEERYNEVLGEAQEKIANGEEELERARAEGQEKLDDAKSQLDDAKIQIEDGQKELDEAKAKIDEATPQIEEAQKKIDEGQAQVNSAKAQLDQTKAPLDAAKAELDKSKEQLDEGQAQLDAAREQLEEASKELAAAEVEIAQKRAELNSGKASIETAKAVIAAGKDMTEKYISRYETAKSAYNTAEAQLKRAEQDLARAEAIYGEYSTIAITYRGILETAKTALVIAETAMNQAKNELDDNQSRLEEAEKTIKENEKKIEEGEPLLEKAEKDIAAARAEYQSGLSEYTDNASKIAAAQVEYQSGLAQYNIGKAQYDAGYQQYLQGKAEFDAGYNEFAAKKAEYDDGVRQYEEGLEALEDAKAKYEQGLIDYEDGKYEYEIKIADAERELSDAKEKIASAGNAQWYIFTRDDNAGYSEYNSNAQRIDKIAAIFPLFFLLVAGLVCLTTMSRMVEEQRTQIGTLKALGYSRRAIMRHYMVYAATAALTGSILGAAGGCFLFPGVIMFAYSMMYHMGAHYFVFAPDNLILSIGSMVLSIMLMVYFSCNKALKETPSSLMRPKAPKAGKRIFLEKMPFVWSKMNFFAKVSARNLIRYKRRMFMTIVGIAGCTALSLTGFGLKDSIMDVADMQYNDIYRYSGYAAFSDNIKLSELESIYTTLTDYNEDTDYTRALIKQYDFEFSGNNMQCYLTAVEDYELFETFVDMRERISGRKITMSDGAVITEKAAKILGAKEGDEITIKVSEGVNRKIKIAAITENYVSHYVYLTEDLYKDILGQSPKYNMVYFSNGIERDDDVQAKFTEHMLENKNVLAVIMNAASLNNIHDTLKIMDLVVLVLIVSAAALAFVVLYNLTNVNITERIREIATLKVLGFYDLEVSSYVFRESIILSMMGAVVGLFLGSALCMFIVTTAEVDEVMFGRSIHAISYLWAFLVTAAFSVAVNLIMTRVLKKVSMVESLKSVE